MPSAPPDAARRLRNSATRIWLGRMTVTGASGSEALIARMRSMAYWVLPWPAGATKSRVVMWSDSRVGFTLWRHPILVLHEPDPTVGSRPSPGRHRPRSVLPEPVGQ